MASRLLQDLPGYSLYKAAQMPFGQNSADFACAQSYTSKQICELPGNLTVSPLALHISFTHLVRATKKLAWRQCSQSHITVVASPWRAPLWTFPAGHCIWDCCLRPRFFPVALTSCP